MTLRDRHVFAAATAVVAIHTITDAFVAPEPGVELADHAVSGLVPLALLAGALACFWLNRERLSAVLALVLGVLALEGFALAVADARAVGVRGDDWTGFALAPAGLALVALGLALLWRSRKRRRPPASAAGPDCDRRSRWGLLGARTRGDRADRNAPAPRGC